MLGLSLTTAILLSCVVILFCVYVVLHTDIVDLLR